MRRAKKIIGILLILASVGGIIYWEGYGRNEFMTEKVLTANQVIPKGTLVTEEMFSIVNVLPEGLLEDVLTAKDLRKVEGKEAVQTILKNQLMSQSFLRTPIRKISENQAPYVIKGEWIDSRSSSLRKGDYILIFSRDGSTLLGEFEVVFVKDTSGQEVRSTRPNDVVSQINPFETDEAIADRTDGSGIIDHVEILASLEEYQGILWFVEGQGQTLLIVQKGASA